MAPPKTRFTRASGAASSLIVTDPAASLFSNNNNNPAGAAAGKKAAKRKADASPQRNDKVKRSALGNLTNASNANNAQQQNGAGGNGKENALKAQAAVSMLLQQHGKQQQQQTQPLVVTRKDAENACPSIGQLATMHQMQQSIMAAPRPTKVLTRAAARATLPNETAKPQKGGAAAAAAADAAAIKKEPVVVPAAAAASMQHLGVPAAAAIPRRRISNEFDRAKADDDDDDVDASPANGDDTSLYMSALESCSEPDRLSLALNGSTNGTTSTEAATAIGVRTRRKTASRDDDEALLLELVNKRRSAALAALKSSPSDAAAEATQSAEPVQDVHDTIAQHALPAGVPDFDRENWDDPFQASHYAMDIFNYLKAREPMFLVDNYMERQVHINRWMRSLLVDWMVEVQETFELNHETLYLAVKLVDLYLTRVVVIKDKLQLLGAAAMFLACKFDERTPPLIDDFLYICDGAYVQKELIVMEMDVFRTIGYDLGMPLSYRFLRRYARVSFEGQLERP